MHRSDLRALLLLVLTTSSFVTCSVDDALQNNSTEGSETVDPTKETLYSLNSTAMSPEGSHTNSTTAVPPSTGPQPPKGNGTAAGAVHLSNGTETNSSKVQPAGTESSPSNQLPEKNATSVTTAASPASTLTPSGEPKERTSESTNISSTTLPEPSSSRTTVRAETTSPTQKSMTSTTRKSTKAHSCPTAEPKRERPAFWCLIGITALATVATVFIFTTIILAVKLVGAKHRSRTSLIHDTEMVCISAFMNDSNQPFPYTKHPKSNGALIPSTEGDDDDLTLNSFLPDAEGAA